MLLVLPLPLVQAVVAPLAPLLAVDLAIVLGGVGALGGVGGLMAGVAAWLSRGDNVKKAQVDYQGVTMEAMRGHMETLAADNKALRQDMVIVRKEMAGLHDQLRKCQDDKLLMQRQLDEWQRKWEAKINEGNAGSAKSS